MRTLALLPLVCLLASPASAQDTFKQVWVTQSDSGEVLRGRIVELSRESLAILTPDNRRVEMPLDRVLRIEARGDSLKTARPLAPRCLEACRSSVARARMPASARPLSASTPGWAR